MVDNGCGYLLYTLYSNPHSLYTRLQQVYSTTTS